MYGWRGKMLTYIQTDVIPLFVLVINLSIIFRTFPTKYTLRFSIAMFILFTVVIHIVFFLIGIFGINFWGWRGILYFPIVIWLFKGRLYQKLCIVFFQHLLTLLLSFLVAAILRIFVPDKSDLYYILLLAMSVIAFVAFYFAMISKYGRLLMKKQFESGRPSELMLYTLNSLLSFIVLFLSRINHISSALYISLLIFILWSLGMLCYAVINTHEKTKKSYEADFAQSIISTGRDHYQKMNEMYDTLHILRHDYKYHLNTVIELANNSDITEIKKYLSEVQAQLPDTDLRYYCKNSVINALLASFAERCENENINYNVQLAMPKTLSITNYDMCIIVGNLLENAMEACGYIGGGKIELAIKSQGAHLAIMVKNSFSGEIVDENGQPVSAKKNGGFGLRSVRAVAARYNGHILTEWDKDTFTAYVMIRAVNNIKE